MRKSLQDLNQNMIRKVDDYPDLPEELKELCYWIADSGYSIMAIPDAVIDEAWHAMDPERYEIPMPVKYVLEKGWKWFEGCIVVPCEYSHEIGALIDEQYNEY